MYLYFIRYPMKQILLIVFSVFLSFFASAQKIHFTDTTNVWNVTDDCYCGGDPVYYVLQYNFLRDTTIGIFKYNIFNFDPFNPHYFPSVSLVREDTILKKVYLRDVEGDSDILFMDYNLSVGDTFKIHSPRNFTRYAHTYYVISIDSTSINGVWHRVWKFSANLTGIPYGPIYIIEGIGCINHPTYMLRDTYNPEPDVEKLHCFWNNYITPLLTPPVSFFNDSLNCLPTFIESAYTNQKAIKIFPNPAITKLTITASDKITTVAITNLLGQTMYSQQYSSQQVQVDVANLSKGIYFIKVNGTEVRMFVKQ